MARSTFGGFGGDQVSLDPAGNSGFYKAAANYSAVGTFWSASTGGTQYTDLIDPVTSVALAGVSTDAHGHVVPFKGPDGITEGWLDFGGGRFKVTAVDANLYAPATGSTVYAPASGSPNYAPASGSPNYAPKTGSTIYLSFQNPSGAYQISPTAMWNRLDSTGSTVNGDGTAGGALEVYTQVTTTGHDLALLVHGHADMHFSRAAPSNRCQLLTITGAPTGGTFTLTYGGQTTTALAYNCSGAAVVSALQALSSVSGAVYVYSGTGGTPVAGGPFTVTMTQPNPGALTPTASLTGGSSPSVTIAQTAPDGMAYFDIPLGGTIPIVGTLTGQQSTGQLAFQLGQSGGSYRFLNNTGAALLTLNNSGILALGTAVVTGQADLPRYYGGGSSGGLAVFGAASGAGTGTSGLIRFRDNDTDNNTRFQVGTAAPASAGATTLAISYHNGTAPTFQFVTVGAADSGGVGFKALRVPN